MEKKGYSPCWHYSSPSIMSPTIWVRKSGFCVDNAGKVRTKVLQWMDSLPNNGNDVLVKVVNKTVDDLLNAWEAEDRKRYPHLYN